MIRSVLVLEGVLALAIARGLVFGVPLRLTCRMLGGTTAVAAGEGALLPVAGQARAVAVARRVGRVADRLPWHSTCLVRAVAGMLLLRRRGIRGAVIRFGVRRGEGALAAHAWLVLGGETLLGGETAGDYVPLADLGRGEGGSGRPA